MDLVRNKVICQRNDVADITPKISKLKWPTAVGARFDKRPATGWTGNLRKVAASG